MAEFEYAIQFRYTDPTVGPHTWVRYAPYGYARRPGDIEFMFREVARLNVTAAREAKEWRVARRPRPERWEPATEVPQ